MSAKAKQRLLLHLPHLALIAILMSLIGPMATLAAPDDDPFDDPPPTATEPPPTCAEGEILSPNNVCVPDPNQQPSCPEGQVIDNNGDCQPLPPPPCPVGEVYDEQGNCVPDPNVQPPGCEAGQVLDQQGNCAPDTEQFPTCDAGTVLNPQTGDCDRIEQPPIEPTLQPTIDDMTAAPPSPTGDEAVIVNYIVCPPDVDLTTASETEGPDGCEGQQDGISFELAAGGAVVDTQVTGSYEPSRARFDDPPLGSLTLTEVTPRTGIALAYCYENTTEGNTRPYGRAPVSMDATPSWTFELISDEVVTCDWFAIGGEGNTITVNKWQCPVGFDIAGATIDDLATFCLVPMDDVWFTLDDAVGRSSQQTAGGSLTFPGVSPGSFRIEESVPAGYFELAVAVCRVDDAAPVRYEALDGMLEMPAIDHPGVIVACDWYNLLLGENERSQISIEKFNCPPGTVAEATRDELAATCTEPGADIEFSVAFARSTRTQITDASGHITFTDVPRGSFTIQETMPPGYETTVWACRYRGYNDGGDIPVEGEVPLTIAPDGAFTYENEFEGYIFSCLVYNIPGETNDNTVTVTKWVCPAETDTASSTFDDLMAVCGASAFDVEFTLTDATTSVTTSTVSGTATWTGISPGEVTLTEHTPPGYLDPVAWCSLTAVDATGTASHGKAPTLMPVYDSTVSRELTGPEFTWNCDFFNVEKGPAELTIHKWTCPAGYDVDLPSADPTVDCTEVTNGVAFTFGRTGDALTQIQRTGDRLDGAVVFTDLDPGSYTVTETLPDGIDTAFTWDCTGTDIGAVHPTPLNRGAVLTLDVAAGDAVVCDWYNVPLPDGGSLTVYKYACWTESFASEVDCQIYESGATFELFAVDGGVSQGVGTTGAGGIHTWTGLDEGAYTLTELSHVPCHIVASETDSSGNPWVNPLEETVVKVFNCDLDPGGKIPTDYPNTGAGPVDSAVSPLMQVGGATTQAASSEDFYQIACLDQPSGTPVPETVCVRGAVPAHLAIDPIGVDAEIEVVEIVDGVMQPPSDPHLAAWYKETARLGEANNTVIAGHLNWWNVPEGVFFRLDELEEGDRIAVTGDDGLMYVYAVRWVRLEPNDAPPALEVVGPTDAPSLTLITCGGEWDADLAEYDARTVVRAVLVDIQPVETASED